MLNCLIQNKDDRQQLFSVMLTTDSNAQYCTCGSENSGYSHVISHVIASLSRIENLTQDCARFTFTKSYQTAQNITPSMMITYRIITTVRTLLLIFIFNITFQLCVRHIHHISILFGGHNRLCQRRRIKTKPKRKGKWMDENTRIQEKKQVQSTLTSLSLPEIIYTRP